MGRNVRLNTDKLAVSAVMITLAAVLSMIKVFEMPLGGAVTLLSMLPVCMISVKYGCWHGLLCGFVFALAQVLLNLGVIAGIGLSPAAMAGCVGLDYLAAFSVLGLAGAFRRRGVAGCIGGIALAAVVRVVCHVASGVIFFSQWAPEGWNALVYSLCYNVGFMLPETVFTVAGAAFLLKEPHAAKLFAPEYGKGG